MNSAVGRAASGTFLVYIIYIIGRCVGSANKRPGIFRRGDPGLTTRPFDANEPLPCTCSFDNPPRVLRSFCRSLAAIRALPSRAGAIAARTSNSPSFASRARP